MSEVQFKTDMRSILTSFAGLSAKIGTRVYHSVSPQGDKPYIVFHDVGGDDEHTHDGVRPSSKRVQFDVVADTALEMEQVVDQLDLAFAPTLQPRTVGSTSFNYIGREGAGTGGYEDATNEESRGLWRRTVDYVFRTN